MMKISKKASSGKAKGCLLTVLAIVFIAVSGFYFLTEGMRDAKAEGLALSAARIAPASIEYGRHRPARSAARPRDSFGYI